MKEIKDPSSVLFPVTSNSESFLAFVTFDSPLPENVRQPWCRRMHMFMSLILVFIFKKMTIHTEQSNGTQIYFVENETIHFETVKQTKQ